MVLFHLRRLPRFLRFCVAGGVAFVVDIGLFELGIRAGLEPEMARIFSVLLALQVNYAFQRNLTFHDADASGLWVWMRFLASNAVGVGVNYGIFLLMLSLVGAEVPERQIAVIAGTAVALVFNYIANSHFVFRKPS